MKIVHVFAIAALLAGSTVAYAQDHSTKNAREFRASVPAGAYQRLNNNFVNPDADYHYPSDGLHPRPAQTASWQETN